ncbi:unnamed protein product [Tuber melanosporum]|uniref:(Perigord truffle) hypothetical protein n=1 Tax=Tuber melanosporum (strain Mel28) TaxID=656061 RepID=D5GJ29_TUBMM|nr:uncharacterized protein GSTUM_00008810001 [Tuber melanosporum]CAZ84522.1 unnamed protein product [Tuber melanosporum]
MSTAPSPSVAKKQQGPPFPPLCPLPLPPHTTNSQLTKTKKTDLQTQYSTYKSALQQLAQKIGDVEQEAEEHKLVLESLEPVDPGRKCFRLVNGVLVERCVGDVIPAVRTNAEGLKSVLEGLVKEYKRKQEEMEKWKVKNNVQVVNR